MTVLTAVLVVFGAASGTIARYEIGRWFTRWISSGYPWGTWVINVMGSLLLGVFSAQLRRVHGDPYWWLVLGTGFCGAFTTFSTMSVEAVQLFRARPLYAMIYLVSSFVCGLVLFWMTQWI